MNAALASRSARVARSRATTWSNWLGLSFAAWTSAVSASGSPSNSARAAAWSRVRNSHRSAAFTAVSDLATVRDAATSRPGQAGGLGDGCLGHPSLVEQGEQDGGVVADGHLLPVVVLVPLLDQPGAEVGLLVAFVAGDEAQDAGAGAHAADVAAVPGADPQLAVRAADDGDRDVVAAPRQPGRVPVDGELWRGGGVRLERGDERLVDGGLGVAARVGVHQQLGRVERLQGDRLGGGVGHGPRSFQRGCEALPAEGLLPDCCLALGTAGSVKRPGEKSFAF